MPDTTPEILVLEIDVNMIKLALADLDDTLIPFGAACASDHARAAIHSVHDAGMFFGPVTGRVPAAMEWMFSGDATCYSTGAFANGQIVKVEGEVIQLVTLQGCYLQRVAKVLDEIGLDAWLAVYSPTDLSDVSIVTTRPQSVIDNPPKTWGSEIHGIVESVSPGPYVKANVQFCCSREQISMIRDCLARRIPELRFVFPSLVAEVLDVNVGEWDKGDAVRLIAKRLSVSLDEVVVFGDSENDLSMIEAVPNSVAVANAASSVLDAACWHIGPAGDDAVASALLDLVEAAKTGRTPSFMR